MNRFRATLQSLFTLKYRVDPLWSAMTVSLWLATAGNAALWWKLSHLPDVSGARGWGLMLALGVAIAALAFGLQALLAGRLGSKLLGCVLLLVTAPATYFMLSYGIVVDATMIKNTLQTDVKESADLISVGLTATVLLVGLLPCGWLILRQHADVRWGRRLVHNATCAVLGLLVAAAGVFSIKGDFATLMRNHKQVRYLITPFNVLYGAGRLAVGEAKPKPFISLGEASVSALNNNNNDVVPVLVLVVGETARADHFSLNGYARPTNPLLAKEAVISFTNAKSCGTNTADSVPCMFSHLGRDAFFHRTANYDNALDVLARAGYSVLWLDNNSGCKGVCERLPNADLSIAKDPAHCTTDGCFDEVMGVNLTQRVQALRKDKPTSKGVVIVMHQLGSHGPAYYKRSPANSKPFSSECTTNVLQNCDAASIINAYDNSIVYTDRFLAGIITQLKLLPASFAPSMVYMSDHGESLGESGTYLHGLPYAIAPDSQKHVPLVMWFSPAAQQQRGLRTDCMKAQASAAVSHDYLFHSLLSWGRVQNAAYKPQLDWFKPCL
jgi:lipid A ethanolaminephosphotransferase